MVLPVAYNPISLSQIQNEFGGSNPISIGEYYRGKIWSFNRYYSNSFDNHFFTAYPEVGEAASINQYSLESLNVFLAYKNNISGTVPLYRFFRISTAAKNQHLLTISESEKSALIASGVWTFEGIVGYVYNTSNAETQPVYRMLIKVTADDYFFTTNLNEYNNTANYNKEGIGFHAPISAYVTDNNTNIPTSGPISFSNFHSSYKGYQVVMNFTRDADNKNYFYLNSPGLPQIEISTSTNGSGSSVTYYIPANVTFTVTANVSNNKIRLNNGWMELEDGNDYDWNDLRWKPVEGTVYKSDGNYYYILNK